MVFNSNQYKLETHARLAIQYIENLPFTQENIPVFNYFFQNWGTGVVVSSIEGGFLNFACAVQAEIWKWGSLVGHVPATFVQGQADSYYQDQIQGTTYSSAMFSQSSVCSFQCTGGSPELCPSSNNKNIDVWAASIWQNPITLDYTTVPISEVVPDVMARQKLQMALTNYYATQVEPWKKFFQACDVCSPALSSYVLAAYVPWNQPTTVNAGTCSTAIRVTAAGSCALIMLQNGNNIAGGNGQCYFTNVALWGSAAYDSISMPAYEWLVYDIDQTNTFSNVNCNYPDSQCNYLAGFYSVSCV